MKDGACSRAWVPVPVLLSCSKTLGGRWVLASPGLLLRQIAGQRLHGEVAAAASEVGQIRWETGVKLKGLFVAVVFVWLDAWRPRRRARRW